MYEVFTMYRILMRKVFRKGSERMKIKIDVGELGARVKFERLQDCAKWLAVKTSYVITKKKNLFHYTEYTYTISRQRTIPFCAITFYIPYEIRTSSTVEKVLYRRVRHGVVNLESRAKKKTCLETG